jgi:hypothetical protein
LQQYFSFGHGLGPDYVDEILVEIEMKKGWPQTEVRSQPFEFIAFAYRWRATSVVVMLGAAIRRGWKPVPAAWSPNEAFSRKKVGKLRG